MTTFKVFGAELAVLAETLSYDYKTICCYDVWTEKSNRLERDCVEVCVHPSVPENIKQIKKVVTMSHHQSFESICICKDCWLFILVDV